MSDDRLEGVLTLTPVAPVHIGSGNVLQDIDYEIVNGRCAVKDVRRFFEANRGSVDYALDAVKNNLPLGDEFVRYAIPFHGNPPDRERQATNAPRQHRDEPREVFNNPFAALQTGAPARPAATQRQEPRRPDRPSGFTVGEIREFIKDPFGKPYVPGTSVKGLLRTALAVHLARETGVNAVELAIRNAPPNRPPKREWAFQAAGKQLFGEKVIEDVLKALVVRDSEPLDIGAAFAVTQVVIMNTYGNRFQEKRGVPIHVESLMPGHAINVPFYVDRYRLRTDRDLAKAARGGTLATMDDPDRFTATLKRMSEDLIRYEIDFYTRKGEQRVKSFFDTLARDGRIHLPLGFGTGWHAKTVGLSMQDGDIETLRRTFRQGRDGAADFPKTRKWAKGPAGALPEGWLRLDIEWS